MTAMTDIMANLSQKKRQRMLEILESVKKEYRGHDEIVRTLSEIEEELTDRKYGLVWEEHEERVDIRMETKIPVFTEVPEKEICEAPGERCNFLLEGDNLHSLKLLEKTHRGGIDVIYIDPPYNTGNHDFIYNDEYVDSEDQYRHSKWLSFMERRMRIAYELLSDDGLLFVSIDDNEQANLKALLDQVFSEENFIITLPRITKKSGKTTGSFSKNHDYVMVYTKKNQNIFSMEEHIDAAFCNEDEWVDERGKYKLNQTLDYDSLSYSPSLDYELEVEGEIFYPGFDKAAWKARQEGSYKRADWAWRWNKKLFDFGYRNGFVVVKRKADGTARIYTKTYLNARIAKDKQSGEYYIDYKRRTKPMSSIGLVENEYSNDNAKKDMASFGLKDHFDYSKPVALIKRLLKNHKNKNAVVLDFFAGSGTTAQAVLELNAEDGGRRTFILCTNNQNEICEKITYKRCRDVIQNKVFCYTDAAVLYDRELVFQDIKRAETVLREIQNIKDVHKKHYDKIKTQVKRGHILVLGILQYPVMQGIPANLKYYRTEWVSRGPHDIVERDLSEHIKELIQLETSVCLDRDRYAVLLTSKDADILEAEWNGGLHCSVLIISGKVQLTAGQLQLFSKAKVYRISNYYSEISEWMRR